MKGDQTKKYIYIWAFIIIGDNKQQKRDDTPAFIEQRLAANPVDENRLQRLFDEKWRQLTQEDLTGVFVLISALFIEKTKAKTTLLTRTDPNCFTFFL